MNNSTPGTGAGQITTATWTDERGADVTPGVHNVAGEMVRDHRRDRTAVGGDGPRRVGLGREAGGSTPYSGTRSAQTGRKANSMTGVARAKRTTGVARAATTSPDASSTSISISLVY